MNGLPLLLLVGVAAGVLAFLAWRFARLIEIEQRGRAGLPIEDLLKESRGARVLGWVFAALLLIGFVVAVLFAAYS
jgi:hypothetical protein